MKTTLSVVCDYAIYLFTASSQILEQLTTDTLHIDILAASLQINEA